jgi:hypothetical protein
MLPRPPSRSPSFHSIHRHRGASRPPLGVLGLGLWLSLGCAEAPDGGGPSQGGSGANPGSGGVGNSSGSGGAAGVGGSGGATSSGGAGTGGTSGRGANGGGSGTAGSAFNGGSAGAAGGGANGGASGATSNGGAAGAGTNGGGAGSGGVAGTAGATSNGGGGAAGSNSGGAAGGGGGETRSAGCDQMRTLQDGNRMVQSGGVQRTYVLRVPADYDNAQPYRLMLGFHGANGRGSDVAPSYFGLWDLSEGSTIFAAPDAVGGLWNASTDTTMVTDLLKQLTDDLCIDESRIGLEGFSQGGAMVWTLACALPGRFNVAVVHSGGGLGMPRTCEPIPFLSTLGTDGSGQGMSSDFFAMTNGCTVESLPMAPTGGHACTNYEGCSAGHPTRWCDYDDGHTPAPTDAGQSRSWVPEEVWNFVEQF